MLAQRFRRQRIKEISSKYIEEEQIAQLIEDSTLNEEEKVHLVCTEVLKNLHSSLLLVRAFFCCVFLFS